MVENTPSPFHQPNITSQKSYRWGTVHQQHRSTGVRSDRRRANYYYTYNNGRAVTFNSIRRGKSVVSTVRAYRLWLGNFSTAIRGNIQRKCRRMVSVFSSATPISRLFMTTNVDRFLLCYCADQRTLGSTQSMTATRWTSTACRNNSSPSTRLISPDDGLFCVGCVAVDGLSSQNFRHWTAEARSDWLLDSVKSGHFEPSEWSAAEKTGDGY